jgi:5-methylcytosine-specific restriction endonuclease McrA
MGRKRKCYKCFEIKDINLFPNDHSKPLNKGYICRECDNRRCELYRRRNGILQRKKSENYRPYKLRFQILKRDNFICQYCGRKAPEVELEVDHIYPESKGGKYVEDNLITSCRDCNIGKSDFLL